MSYPAAKALPRVGSRARGESFLIRRGGGLEDLRAVVLVVPFEVWAEATGAGAAVSVVGAALWAAAGAAAGAVAEGAEDMISWRELDVDVVARGVVSVVVLEGDVF